MLNWRLRLRSLKRGEIDCSRLIYKLLLFVKCSNSKRDKMINEKDKDIADLNTELGKLQAELAGLQSKFASTKTGLENTKKILEREITVRDN